MNFSAHKKIFSASQHEHEKFKKYFGINNTPTPIELAFYKKINIYLRYISWIPGVRMIGIGNSISMNCATSDSDIDLYIVTAPKRLWLVRILVTAIFQLLGVRKTDKHHAGKFCLSFFSTTQSLNFGVFALEKDLYLYFWIVYFKPIFDINNTYLAFLKQNENWCDFSEYIQIISENKKYIKYSRNISERNSLSTLYDFLDHLLRKIFLSKTLRHYEKIGKPYGVIINNNMLKFHNGDIRKQIKEKLK